MQRHPPSVTGKMRDVLRAACFPQCECRVHVQPAACLTGYAMFRNKTGRRLFADEALAGSSSQRLTDR